ncbi:MULTISPECIES: restriction endonuclease subunit S [Acinetobacter]|uniref:Restriction endonuclease subunit S n=1 Tax=Acinetobacter junii TaxID=40215 RepID=A0A365PLL6_ACIJU|nr:MULTISPECIES: restriction endonuclease subunit S [Acinetobacter]RBA41924.1 restriction endonuclease subunit S [Acinetobacter junii]RBA42761.1 restriction endonuclease subunit S [Acinetobacter junii]RBA49399.1 restriction endonuclease subunit S [Acinetobacter junii]WLF72571.1 restriction endonuclease subunit S [Acinetobacter junii]
MTYPQVDLGSVVDLQAGIGFPTRLQGKTSGKFPFAKVGDISRNGRTGKPILSTVDNYIDQTDVESLRAKIIPEGSILFAKIGEAIKQNHRVISHRSLLIDNNAMAAIPSEKIDNLYLYYFLKQVDFYRLAPATTVPALRKSDLEKIKIPLPPLAEQRRIASILDQADELRQKRQQAIEKLDQLLQATFIDMFGDPEKNPKKWNKVVLGDICDQKDRVNYGVVQPGNEFEGGVPLIRVGDIDGGILSFHLIKRIDPEIEKDYSRSRIKGNEVLVSCVGSIGTIAKVPNEAIGFNIARAITRVPLQDKRIINFVAECLKTEAIQNYFKKNTRTVSQPTLNVSFVKETEIIFPNEEKILDFCKIVDKVEFQKELLQKALVMQESLFQSLQNQAFNGTL